MRILQINSHYDQGGAGKIVANIHRMLLKDENVQSYVAFGRGKIPEDPNTYRFDTQAEVYLSAFLSRYVGLNGWWNWIGTWKLLRYMDRVKPDVIHLHTLHGYYVNFNLLFRYIHKHHISCIWTFHDCHAFTGNCGYYFNCHKWKTGCGNCDRLLEYPTSRFFDFTKYMWNRKKKLVAGTDLTIVTPSQWLASKVRESFFKQFPCKVIYNGIDTVKMFYPKNASACRRKYHFSEDDRIILGVAVDFQDSRKGGVYILEMARALQDTKVILVGWNKKNDKLIEDIPNVIPLPATGNPEILTDYYSMADVFVIPSLAENYPTTGLEAMACGTPVVGFDVGGISEQMKEGCGLVVPSGDQEAFNEAVRTVLHSVKCGDGRFLKGPRLAQIIQKDNSERGMAIKYRELYEDTRDKGIEPNDSISMYCGL